jgi:hypothetical protein
MPGPENISQLLSELLLVWLARGRTFAGETTVKAKPVTTPNKSPRFAFVAKAYEDICG